MNSQDPSQCNSHSRGRSGHRGFSLVEILVVITIIVGLLSVAAKMMGGGGNAGQATRTANLQLKAMVELAQAQAVGSGNSVALLIYNKYEDTGANERYLRFIQIVELSQTASQSSDGTATQEYVWTAVGNGTSLPPGVYYWPEGFTVGYKEPLEPGGTLELGAALKETKKDDWIGLVFNAQGLPQIKGDQKNLKFLVTTGTPSSTGLEVTEKQKLLTEGFIVQPNGRTIGIESPAAQLVN